MLDFAKYNIHEEIEDQLENVVSVINTFETVTKKLDNKKILLETFDRFTKKSKFQAKQALKDVVNLIDF